MFQWFKIFLILIFTVPMMGHAMKIEDLIHKKDSYELEPPNFLFLLSAAAAIESTQPKKQSDTRIIRKRKSDFSYYMGKEKAFKCTYPGCTLAYSHIGLLNDHKKRAHEDNKYKCSYAACTKAFPYPNNLERHVITEHSKRTIKGKAYLCTHPNCMETFGGAKERAEHILLPH